MAKNHPLIKDVKKWILDSFSFMDGIGYDIQYEDDIYGMENTTAISADVDGLKDFDFEKGKENLLKSVPNKVKAEFPYLRISSAKDGDYFVMFITLLDNNDYLENTKLTYFNLNESKTSAIKSLKESKMTLQDAWDNNDKDLFLSIIQWLENTRKITHKEFKDLKEVYDNWEEYKEMNPNAKIKFGNIEVKIEESLKEEYDPTDDIINKGNSVGMDYETFLKFAEKQDYKFNVTDATFYFGINSNIKIEGRECSCIPSEDGILIIDNHSSIEIPRKDIDIVEGVSLNSKNVLRMDVFTKDGDALTVWWRL